jgi:hypothetical protein
VSPTFVGIFTHLLANDEEHWILSMDQCVFDTRRLKLLTTIPTQRIDADRSRTIASAGKLFM